MTMTDQPTPTAPAVHRPGRWFAIALLGFIAMIAGFLFGQTEYAVMHVGVWFVFLLLILGGAVAIVVGLLAGCVAAIRR